MIFICLEKPTRISVNKQLVILVNLPSLITNSAIIFSPSSCTQLVKIEKNGDNYSFDFTLLKRWIELCKKNNMKYFEISHLFSQWGLKYAPNIKVSENGEDIEICRMLESFIGRDKVIEMIDNEAGMDLTYSQYPRNPEFVPDLIGKMEQMIKSYIK